MTFYGSVSINYSIINPYAEEEDYMNVPVTRDWNTLENIFLDLLDAGLNVEPVVDEDNTGYPYHTDITFQLIELDADGKYIDFAQFSAGFYLGKDNWQDYNYYFAKVGGDNTTYKWFMTTPPISSTVKALVINAESYPQDPNPIP